MDKNIDIEVFYISGLPGSEFEVVRELGYEADIPEKQEFQPMASVYGPEDYIIIFGIYFSLKVAEELSNKAAKKLANNFYKVIKKLWTRFKDTKPALVDAHKRIYKLPKAVISFKVSETEQSTLEITNDLSDKQIKSASAAYLKLVKLQYKNRKKENELKKRFKK